MPHRSSKRSTVITAQALARSAREELAPGTPPQEQRPQLPIPMRGAVAGEQHTPAKHLMLNEFLQVGRLASSLFPGGELCLLS